MALHDDICASHKGLECNCPAAALVPSPTDHDPDPIVYKEMTLDEAVAFVKRSRNRSIFLHVGQSAMCVDQSGVEEGYERTRKVSGSVRLSAPAAVKFLNDAYRYAADKVTINVGYASRIMFIGRGY